MEITDQIIEQLVGRIEIERIYQFSYIFLKHEYTRLLIVIKPKCNISPAILEPEVSFCLKEVPDITYMLIASGELKASLKSGSLFYVKICQEENLRYHDGKKLLLMPSQEELALILHKTNEHFHNGQKKAGDFMDGMNFYISSGNFQQATFMLHQAAELTLRATSNAIFKRDKPSHSLQEHLKLISRFLPAINKLFPRDNEFEFSLLKLLDKAYSTVRYKNNYEIEEEELSALIQKIKLLIDWCEFLVLDFKISLLEYKNAMMDNKEKATVAYNEAIKTIQIEKPEDKKESPFLLINELDDPHQKQMDIILNNVKQEYPVLQIVFLGAEMSVKTKNTFHDENGEPERNSHCYLLVILNKGKHGNSHTITRKGLKVTILFHPQNIIKFALEKYNRFFIHALGKGKVLYTSSQHTVTLNITEPDWAHTYESSKLFASYHLEHLANKFYTSACAIQDYIDDSCSEPFILMISQSIEHACMSFIYVHTGYRVNQHNLPFLLDLCDMISHKIRLILHENTTYDQNQMNTLVKCFYNLRHSVKLSVEYDDMTAYLKRCSNLVEAIENCCEIELERLKKLAYPEATT